MPTYKNNKLSKESKKYYIRELHQYWRNKEKLHNMLDNCNSFEFERIPTRTLVFLQERIFHVEAVMCQLKPYELDIFDMIFRQNLDWLFCKSSKNIDKNTYYTVLNKSVFLLAQEFGEI